jgi:hypothetical protein
MAVAYKISDLTGPGHTDHVGIGGTDLGVSTLAPDGALVAAFGDTFDGAGVGGPGWRSPVVLRGDAPSVPSGLRWTGDGYAEQAVRYRHGGRIAGERITTVLPTDVITVGDTMYLHVMACSDVGTERGTVHWTQFLRSDDSGRRWRAVPAGRRDPLTELVTLEHGGDGWIYALSTGFRRDAGLVLHRVPERGIEDPTSWQPWGFRDGAWAWGNPPTPVLTGAFGELSLRRLPDGWVLLLFDEAGYRIDALRLTGPTDDLFAAPRVTVLDGCGWGAEDHARGRVAQLYGPAVLPGSTLADLHFAASQWHTETGWPYRAMQFRARAPFRTKE